MLKRRTALVTLASAVLAAPRIARAAETDIVVGATVPITGALAGTGLQYYDSLQMAQEDINAAGGINGRKLRVAFEDTQASNSVAVNAFIKLVQQQDPCFVFLSSYSVQNLAVGQSVLKAEVPTVYSGGAVAIADRKNPWMFRIRPQDDLAFGAITAAVTGPMKGRNVGLIHIQDDFGTASANAVEAALAPTGVKVVGRETYNPGDNDLSAQFLSLKAKGADAYVATSYIRDGALVLTQRRRLGITAPLIGNAVYATPGMIDLVTPEDLVGVYTVVDAVLGPARGAKCVDYLSRFSSRFRMRGDAFGSCYYDAAMMLADGLRAVGADKVKLRDWFAAVKGYEGVTRSFTADDRNNMAHNVALAGYGAGTKDLGLAGYYPPQPG